MARLKVFFRYFRYAVLVLLAFVAGAAAVLTLTERGRANLAGLVSDFISSPGQTVRVSDIDGIWSGRLRVGALVLEDRDGPWLVARDVAVDWSPMALFSSTFHAERIAARRVELARLPKSEPAPAEKEPSGSSLPVALALDRIDLPDIALGPELAGGVAAISARGSLRAEAAPTQIEGDFDVARTDGQAGNAQGAIRFIPDENVIDINVSLSEPAGGILANLLQLPGAPPVELAVMGSGPADDWALSGTFSVDGQVVTRVQGKHSLTAEGRVIEASGDGEFDRFLPASLRPLLAGRASFDFAGALTADGGFDIERATLESDTVRGSATGMVDPQGASDFALDLSAIGGAVPLSFGTAESPIDIAVRSASVRALGDGRQPNLDIAAVIDRVSTKPATLDTIEVALHSDAFDIATRSGPVSGSLTSGKVTLENAMAAPLVAGQVKAAFAGMLAQDGLSLDQGSFSSDALSGAINGRISFADGSIDLDVSTDIASAALPAQLHRALGERAAIAATIRRDASGGLSADPLSVTSGPLSVSGKVSQAGDTVDADLSGSFADLGVLSPEVSGPIALTLTASGAMAAPDFSLGVTSDALKARGYDLSGAKLSATGKADPANPSASVSLAATLLGEKIDASGRLSGAEGRYGVEDLALSFGANRISGALALAQDFVPEGTLALDLTALDSLAKLAGETASGSVSGQIVLSRDADGRPQVVLDARSPQVARGDASASDVAVSATVADYLSAPVVSGNISAASAASGGTVAQDVAIALTRDGDWTGFDGGATLSGVPAKAAGRVRVVDGVVTVELASAEAALNDFKAVLAETGTIRVADGAVALENLAFDVAGGRAVLSGTAGSALDVNAIFTVPQDGTQLSFGGSESPINITVKAASVRATGPADSPKLDIAASITKVSTKSAAVEGLELALHSDAFDIARRSGPVTGNAKAAAVVIDDPNIAPLVSGELRAEIAGTLEPDRLTVSSGTLSSGAFTGNFNGDVSLADGSITLQLATDVASAALPAAVRGVLGERTTIEGKLQRSAAGDLTAEGLSIRSDAFSATGRASVLEKGIDAQIQGGLADVGRLAAGATGAIEFAATAKGDRAAPDVAVDITSSRMEVAGRRIDGLKLTATGKADAANPSGDVSLTGTVAGEALTGSARLTSADGRREVQDLALSLGENKVTGALTLDEKFQPLGAIDFALPDLGPLAALALETADGDLAGKISFGQDGDGTPTLKLDARSASVQRGDMSARDVAIDATVSNYLAAPVVAGRIRAAEALSGATAVTGIDVTLSRDGGWTAFDGGATVSGIPAKAAGRVQIADGKTVIELRSAEATVNGVKIPIGAAGLAIENGAASVQNLEIDLGGGKATITGTTGENLDLDITLADVPASLANPFAPGLDAAGLISGNAKVTGQASNPNADFSVRLKGAETSQTRQAKLGPLDVTATGKLANRRISFDATAVNAAGLSVRGVGSVDITDTANPAIDVELRLASIPAALANAFAPNLAASGTISGTATIRGTPSAPAVDFSMALANGETAQTRAAGLGAADVTATGKFAGGKLTFNTNVNGGAGLTLRGGGSVDTGGAQALALDFTGQLPFEFLSARLAAQGLSLSGGASFDVQIRGTTGAPSFAGSVRTSGARVVDARSGLSLNDIAADIGLGGNTATLRSMTGSLSSGGTVSASGTVGIDPAGGFPANLALRIADGRYTDGRVVTSTLSGDLTLTGSLVATPTLSGTINLAKTVITVPQRLPSSLAQLDVKRRDAPAAVRKQDRALRPPEQASGGGAGGINLDITVNANNQIFVQGRGLDAELGGSLRLVGPTSAPQATGQFTLTRGRLAVLGRRLTFTRGTITFAGSLIPYLDLAADSNAGDTTVTVTVSGPANNPAFDFASVPVLPEDEVLARLIFGRSMSNLSPLQIAQLAEAAAQFAGVGGNTSLLETLRGQLGVDDLDIKTTEDGGTAVAVGKYLNDRTYLSLEKGDKAGSGKATIDLNVGRGVKLRGQATDEGEAKGGIFFEREY